MGRIIVVIAFLSCTFNALGQTSKLDTLEIRAISHSFNDSIVVRWAPNDIRMWELALKTGYKVERVIVEKNNKQLSPDEQSKSKRIWDGPFKPLPATAWLNLMDKEEIAGVAVSALFGEDLEVIGDEAGQIKNKDTDKKNRMGFCLFAADESLEVAKALGLAIVDNEITSNEVYKYQISLSVNIDSFIVVPGQTFISKDNKTILPKPKSFVGEFGSKQVQLSWNRKDGQSFYSSYNVERSEDEGKSFKKINSYPIVYAGNINSKDENMYYFDTLAENGKIYVYQVRGKTPFGELGPPSDTIQGSGKPEPMRIHPQIKSIEEFPEGKITVGWTFPEDLNGQLKGFNIYRAKKEDLPFDRINKELLAPDIRSFIDQAPLRACYYMIKAIDLNGFEVESFTKLAQLIDHEPPIPPINLKGKLDGETGALNLKWDQNKEDDVKGYRVYTSNSLTGTFAQVVSVVIQDTFFSYVVNMDLLNEEIYYKVVAVDFRENTSKFSEVCVVKRPDKTPPVSPILEGLNSSVNAIVIKWYSSPSKDVVSHVLKRKAHNEKEWVDILSYTEETKRMEYQDTTVAHDIEYEYRVLATDDAQFQSYSKIVSAKLVNSGVSAEIEDLQVRKNLERRSIQLTWNYLFSDGINQFIVYRGYSGEDLTTYKVVDLSQVQRKEETQEYFLEDFNVSKGKTYVYQVQGVLKNGSMSRLPTAVQIKY